jgi:hypothetical protein
VEIYGEEYCEEVFGHGEMEIETKFKDEKERRIEYLKYECIIESGFNIYILMSWFLDHQDVLNEEDDDLQQFLIEFEAADINPYSNSVFGNLLRLADQTAKKLKKGLNSFKSTFKLTPEERRKRESERLEEAMGFFRKNTNHIEVVINGDLEKIYFPVLPMCHRLTSQFRDEFNEDPDLDRSSAKLKIDRLM